jgi:hypothetical protein
MMRRISTRDYDQSITLDDGTCIEVYPISGGAFTHVRVVGADRRTAFTRSYVFTGDAVSEFKRQCRIYGATED